MILLLNIIVALILCFFDFQYLYSFEISFVCSMMIFFSSFKSMQNKVNTMVDVLKNDIIDEDSDMSKKEKFFIGTRISFGLFRILSYIILGFCIIGLVNNHLFFIIPFMLGTIVSSFGLAFLLLKK